MTPLQHSSSASAGRRAGATTNTSLLGFSHTPLHAGSPAPAFSREEWQKSYDARIKKAAAIDSCLNTDSARTDLSVQKQMSQAIKSRNQQFEELERLLEA